MAESIPSLDLNDYLNGSKSERQRFVQKLGEGFADVGFVAVANHELHEDLRHRLYEKIRGFFELPQQTKDQYEIPGLAGQRGYVAPGREHAKTRTTPDLKEFYHIGQEVQDGDPIQAEYPDNIWPAEVPSFQDTTLEAYRALERTGIQLLRAIAEYLELDRAYFDDKVHNGNSILRPIHYYPIPNPEGLRPDAVRAAEHEDINLITLLMGASAEGLEILSRKGTWVPVTALPDQIVVNVGDMLQRLTNNVLRSTTHRVVNPGPEKIKYPRYSIPFFLHPRSDMDLDCLPNCISEDNPKRYEPITAGEYLRERLREIGLLEE
jgi:isopenicillin N synthase-like dioxygenase